MGGFLYYLPGRSAGIGLAEVQAAGLAYAIDGPISTVGVRGGPDGGDGVLVALTAAVAPEQLRYQADAQTWRKAPNGDLYVGMHLDQSLIPNPQSLARPRQLAGHEVVLADGRPWLVPMARGWTEEVGDLRWYHALPQRSVLGEDGRWRPGDVLPRFAALWILAMRFEEARRQALFGIEGAADGKPVQVAFDFDGLHEAAVRALLENYRVGPAEVDLLGLLTGDIAREILEALIDLPTRVEWFQKKQSVAAGGGSSTAAGSPAGTAAIAPPAPTSGR
jgi:hypothetical protein